MCEQKPQNQSCVRCGTCCGKGGPALHDEDFGRVENGIIPLSSLVTFRKGEMVRDNVSGGLIRLDAEVIKIKSAPESMSCIYYEDAQKECRIYEQRPAECRAQKCWDEHESKDVYDKRRLTRQKLLGAVQWMSELVLTHESRCSFDEIRRYADLRESGDPKGAEALQEMINDDAHFRYLLTDKGNIAADMLDFLLGRPLAQIIPRQFGIKVGEISEPRS